MPFGASELGATVVCGKLCDCPKPKPFAPPVVDAPGAALALSVPKGFATGAEGTAEVPGVRGGFARADLILEIMSTVQPDTTKQNDCLCEIWVRQGQVGDDGCKASGMKGTDNQIKRRTR